MQRKPNIRRKFMRYQPIILLAAAFLALNASPAFAPPVAVPGPVAGAGLGYLVVAGGYYLVRHWRKHKSGE
jgi:hypothetical protein